MKKPIYIYALMDPRNQEVRYVGLTRFPNKRLNNEIHYAHNKHLRNWISSLKQDGIRPEMTILEICTKDADACERKWIAFHRSLGCKLLNYTDGGETGFKFSESAIEKLRIASSSRRYGPMSEEHKAKIAAANKGKMYNPGAPDNLRRLNKLRAGIPLSEEHRRKVSEGVRRSMTPEYRQAMSERNRGRVPYQHTEETRRNVAEGLRRWHANNKATFLKTMSRRKPLGHDPITGRFLSKTEEQHGLLRDA